MNRSHLSTLIKKAYFIQVEYEAKCTPAVTWLIKEVLLRMNLCHMNFLVGGGEGNQSKTIFYTYTPCQCGFKQPAFKEQLISGRKESNIPTRSLFLEGVGG